MNPAAPVVAGEPVTAYLAEVDRRLRGPRRRRRRILAELSDGLEHATGRYLAAGRSGRQAADAAIAQFGSPQQVADAFAGELSTAYARRAIALYVVTGPLVGVWWLLVMHPDPWRTGLAGLLAAIPVLPLIVIAIGAAGGVLATTGRLMRWLPEVTPGHALTATAAIAGLCLVGDLTMIALLRVSAVPVHPLAAIAVAASVIRIGCGVTVIRRTALMRRTGS